MRASATAGLLLACGLLAVLPARLAAQERVHAPAAANSVTPGFRHVWSEGLVRTASGWVARGYARVEGLDPNSPAARAGVRDGDLIISVDGRDGLRPPLFRDLKPGSKLVMRVRRGDEEREIEFEVSR